MAGNLSRADARTLTETIDRIASTLQNHHATFGIPEKVALDFAYRCDLISDTVEKTAIDKTAEAAVDELGAEVSGPIFEENASPDLKGQFTQKDFSELTEMAEKLEKKALSLRQMADDSVS